MTVVGDVRSAAARAGLVLSKLQPPAARGGTVRRGGLLRRLIRLDGPPLVSIVAPGGYGKTTMLSQWAEECIRAFAWLSVDKDDNDVAILVREIEATLRAAGVITTAPGGKAGSGRSASRLRAAVSVSETPFVLVLDDAHELTSVDAHDFLAALVRAIPQGSQLVLSGRVELTDVVAAARAHRDVLDLGPADLALDTDEARALLATVDASFTGPVADAYVGRAEGWAAGLYLLALTRPAPGEDEAASERYVADYLWAQHLASVPEARLRFLLVTSVLDRLCGPLCDALLGREGSAALLDEIATESPFLLPLDREGEWYRYHDLFRAALLRELERREPGTAREARQRASDWCAAHDLVESAMTYAVAADDTDRMAAILTVGAFVLYRTGHVATLAGWLDLFDDGALLAAHPGVAALGVMPQALLDRPFHAERWLDVAVREAPTAPPPPDGSASLDAWVAVGSAFLCRNGPERMLEDAETAIAGLSPFSLLLGTAFALRGVALDLCGDADARLRLEEAAEVAEGGRATFAWLVSLSWLAALALEREDVDEAEALCRRYAETIEETVFEDYHLTLLARAVAARVRLARGDTDGALRMLVGGQRVRARLTHAFPHVNVRALVEMARCYLDLGDAAAAKAVLFDAEEIARRRPELGRLRDELAAIRRRATSERSGEAGWEHSLTAAELRLLPLLTTHLSFREIGERLFVSRNTVKTQAISIYRKLGASSRAEAVTRAAELGLIEADAVVVVR